MHAMTAAHKTLPFGTMVKVNRRDTGADVTVRINDRGPFHGGRVIDVAVERVVLPNGGEAELEAFAAAQVAGLEARCRAAIDDAGADPIARAEALAAALSAEGYAANASTIASGGQLCQHHCPVAHVAAEFPQLCEAETAVISRLIGTHVQRLATIAHGDGVCTTHIPDPRRAGGAPTVAIDVSTDHVTSTVRTDR